MKSKVLILDNIRSVVNVGAIFRTADAVGVDKIFLIGITPAPVDRFGRERQDLAKAALGGEKSVQWEQRKNIDEVISELKEQDFDIVALELDEKAVDYKSIEIKSNTAVIVGNEVDGISDDVLNKVDTIAQIPMNGIKESLNVSVATGVLLYRLFDR
jgi:23S rRNA (guanosine2251-2'-O)-methyltransferase